MRPPLLGRTAGILLAWLLLAACSGAPPSPTPASADDGQWLPETAWDRALEEIDEDGHFSLDAALNLFVTAFGPLPGVNATHDPTGVKSGTLATVALMAHWDALTTEQQVAVEQYIRPPEDALLVKALPVTAARNAIYVAATTSDELKQAIVDARDQFRTTIADNLRRDMLGEINIHFVAQPADEPRLLGRAWGEWPGGTFGSCDISLFPHATTAEPLVVLNTLAHEMFHCFQFDAYRTQAALSAAPGWVIEGQAEWVGNIVGGIDASDYKMWQRYLTAPYISLTQRTYDAIGFYAHLDETGTDPWLVFLDMWAAGGNNRAIFEAARAHEPAFADSWAPGVLREPALGTAWDTTGPGITDDKFLPARLQLGVGGSIDIGAPFFTNDADFISTSAPLFHVWSEGRARLSDGNLDTIDLDDDWFCTLPEGCECPDGTPLPFAVRNVSGDIALATSGSHDGTIGAISGHSLEELCEDPPSPRPDPDPDPDGGQRPGGGLGRPDCGDGCAMSNGDPHIVTVDGFGYDFQAAGEFVLLRSADGSLELQARQEPYPGSNNVTINTAAAVRAGDRRIAVHTDTAARELRVLLDGQPVDATQPVDLGGGVTLADYGDSVDVSLADGTYVSIISLPGYGLNILVAPSAAMRTSGVGVMGPVADGDGIPPMPDGTTTPFTFDEDVMYQALYVRFAEAWRVTDQTSLFDYAPGESTATFTIAGYPRQEDLVDLDSLTDAQRAAGEAACAHIGDPLLRAHCIFDVGITADPGFAQLYDTTVRVTTRPSSVGTGEQVRVLNLFADEDGPVAIDVYAWAHTNLFDPQGGVLVASVDFGAVSGWFEPPAQTSGSGERMTQYSFTRRGEPLVAWAFNLYDLGARLAEPGARRTFLLGTGVDEILGTDQRLATPFFFQSNEEHPDDPWVPRAPDGRALLVVNNESVRYPQPDQSFFVGAGDGCLTQPDFPTLAERVGPLTTARQLALEPGTHAITLHASDGSEEPFAFRCTTSSLTDPLPLTVAAGDRVYLFIYGVPGDDAARAMVLPFGP